MFSFYLWGIETGKGAVVDITAETVFILPMRNWNFCLKGINYGGVWVFILPMRNWNLSRRLRVLFWGFLFSFYLWGIETRSPLFFPPFLPCFHSTYEELKPSICPLPWKNRIVFILPMRNWNSKSMQINPECFDSFHSTYEELKPISHSFSASHACLFSFYLWGIETRRESLSGLIDCMVFILPMRNWNIQHLVIDGSIDSMFSFYLWGIETKEGKVMNKAMAEFSFYLWGIETPTKSGT